jgi:hypothetical protein
VHPGGRIPHPRARKLPCCMVRRCATPRTPHRSRWRQSPSRLPPPSIPRPLTYPGVRAARVSEHQFAHAANQVFVQPVCCRPPFLFSRSPHDRPISSCSRRRPSLPPKTWCAIRSPNPSPRSPRRAIGVRPALFRTPFTNAYGKRGRLLSNAHLSRRRPLAALEHILRMRSA